MTGINSGCAVFDKRGRCRTSDDVLSLNRTGQFTLSKSVY
jgi:hypothetical protein